MNWIVNQHSYTAQRVFCIGRNYVEHIAELGNERPEQPVIFTKPATSLHPVSEPVIPLPRCGELPHYETEITVLVGKKGVPRTAEEAVSFIAGIGAGLDLTLRETQEKLLAHGLPWVSFADLMAIYSNRPEFLTTATKSIIPTSTPMVLTSTCAIAVSTVKTCVTSRRTAPATAAVARWIFSDMIATITAMKITIAIISLGFIWVSPLFQRLAQRPFYDMVHISTLL